MYLGISFRTRRVVTEEGLLPHLPVVLCREAEEKGFPYRSVHRKNPRRFSHRTRLGPFRERILGP